MLEYFHKNWILIIVLPGFTIGKEVIIEANLH